jgi:hypothetical protein
VQADLPYEVDRRIWGATVVLYKCPHCGHDLESPLDEAGTRHDCPTCLQPFVTPGITEKLAEAEEKERRAYEGKVARNEARDLRKPFDCVAMENYPQLEPHATTGEIHPPHPLSVPRVLAEISRR